MLGSEILGAAIGLILLYLVVAAAVSALVEQISQFVALRPNNLWESLCSLLGDNDGNAIAARLLDYPTIKALAVGNGANTNSDASHPADRAMPSYIPSTLFAQALVDILIEESNLPPGPVSSNALAGASFTSVIPDQLLKAVQPILMTPGATALSVKTRLADWYDETMARATGLYRRKIQGFAFLSALIIVLVLNADTITVANKLWSSPAAREQAQRAADQATSRKVTEAAPMSSGSYVSAGQDANSSVSLANMQGFLGWASPTENDPGRRVPSSLNGWIFKLMGLAITVLAALMGAPFWFNALKQTMSTRDAITGKEKSS